MPNYEYEKHQRSTPPQHGEGTLQTCFSDTLADFLADKSHTVHVSCVCAKHDTWTAICELVKPILDERNRFPNLSPATLWEQFPEESHKYSDYCNHTVQDYICNENTITCYFTATNTDTTCIFETMFIQGLAPLLLHHNIPPTDQSFRNIKSYFFSMRKVEHEDEAFNTVCNNVSTLLAQIGLTGRVLHLIIHFQYGAYQELCRVINNTPALALNRIVKIDKTFDKYIKDVQTKLSELDLSNPQQLQMIRDLLVDRSQLFALHIDTTNTYNQDPTNCRRIP